MASRVILLTTIAVGVTVAIVASGAYMTARMQLQESLDRSLIARAEAATKDNTLLRATTDLEMPPWALGAADVRIAFLRYDGTGRIFDQGPYLRLGAPELDVAQGKSRQSVRTITAGGERYRVVAVPTSDEGLALIIAQSLEEQDRVLSRLGVVMLVVGILGVLVAAVAGWAVARNGLRPVRRLTGSVEGIARTEDLTPLPVEGDDEVARLATAFNQMLLALDASRQRQRQLVADASHELRTPLTSLRTNVELLSQAERSSDRLPPQARRELLEDIAAQTQELTTLIGDLTELARDEPLAPVVERVDLRDVLDQALARVRRRAPGVRFEVEAESWWLDGDTNGLARAFTNVLDNAAKWSPPTGRVLIRLRDGELRVDDEGPGIARADRERVFDRFWRAEESRTMPGSGLGLAIVRQIVERHSGDVEVTDSPAGGARLIVRLPGTGIDDE